MLFVNISWKKKPVFCIFMNIDNIENKKRDVLNFIQKWCRQYTVCKNAKHSWPNPNQMHFLVLNDICTSDVPACAKWL